MDIGNLILSIIFTIQIFYIYTAVFSKQKKLIQRKNKKLDKLRVIKIKTLKEQKAFLNTKYPKRKKIKWTWKGVGRIFLMSLFYFVIIRGFLFLFNYFNIVVNIWMAISIAIILPILINLVLKKYNLHQNDLLDVIK